MTNYPGGTDSFPSAATLAAEQLSTAPHSTLHGNLGDALTAVETQLGVTGAFNFALLANNLSDLPNKATARTNLGLGTAATQNSTAFDAAGAAAASQSAAESYADAHVAGHAAPADAAGWLHNDGTGVLTWSTPGGSGTVTSVSAGNLSPLFTTSVATATTTPALSFTLTNQSANLVYAGPSTGAAAAPTFRSLVVADLPTGIPNANLANSSVTINGAGGITGGGAVSLGGSITLTGTVLAATNNYRLTLTSGTPVTTSDVTGATTLYLTPFNGDYIATYDSSAWTLHEPGEISLALSGLTSGKNYDVFAYYVGGTFKIDLGPTWNSGAIAGSDTARGTGAGSTELQMQNGVWTNKNSVTGLIHGDTIAANAGRYVGTIRTTGTTTTEDSAINRLVWNANNRISRQMRYIVGDFSWSETSTSWTCHYDSANSRYPIVSAVFGLAVDIACFHVAPAQLSGSFSGGSFYSIGYDSSTAEASNIVRVNATTQNMVPFADLGQECALGYHQWAIIEMVSTGVTATYYSAGTGGLNGEVMA